MKIFKKFPKLVYEDVLRFLALTTDHRNYFPIVNQHRKFRLRFLGKFTQNFPMFLWLWYQSASNRFGERFEKYVETIVRYNEVHVKRKQLRPKIRKEMVQEFSEDVDRLSILIKKDLRHWKS